MVNLGNYGEITTNGDIVNLRGLQGRAGLGSIRARASAAMTGTCKVNLLASAHYVSIQLSGTFTGTVQFEGSLDGVTFTAMDLQAIGAQAYASAATAVGVFVRGIGA